MSVCSDCQTPDFEQHEPGCVVHKICDACGQHPHHPLCSLAHRFVTVSVTAGSHQLQITPLQDTDSPHRVGFFVDCSSLRIGESISAHFLATMVRTPATVRARASVWRSTAWRACLICGAITYVRDAGELGWRGARHNAGCKHLQPATAARVRRCDPTVRP